MLHKLTIFGQDPFQHRACPLEVRLSPRSLDNLFIAHVVRHNLDQWRTCEPANRGDQAVRVSHWRYNIIIGTQYGSHVFKEMTTSQKSALIVEHPFKKYAAKIERLIKGALRYLIMARVLRFSTRLSIERNCPLLRLSHES